MFEILSDNTMCLTRGDIAQIHVSADTQDGGTYTFTAGDVVRLQVFDKKDCTKVLLSKPVTVLAEAQSVIIALSGDETKIGEPINKPVDYRYEIELNPETNPQTIIGYDESGEKIFRLYPEGGE